MTMKRRPIVAGNWKMNGNLQGAVDLLTDILDGLDEQPIDADIVVCPPHCHLGLAAAISEETDIALGGQDCSDRDNGAFTGDVSAQMLAELTCKYVILGHSERRQYHGESDALVLAKAARAIENDLIPIICIGETLDQRQAGETMKVIKSQLAGSIPTGAAGDNIVVAYEPVWAIGTGLVASLEQIAEVHGEIRQNLENRLANGAGLRVIYGGSVKPDNARDILSLDDVDGALVGGASLKGKDFLEIAAKAV